MLKKILKSPEIRNKILFSLFVLIVFRLMAHVPVPGVNLDTVKAFLQGNAIFGLFDLFSGGGLQNFSIVTLGLGPYINASIILQLFTAMVPSLEELQKEGESGREKINQYTRLLTIPLSLLQAYGIYFLLNRQGIIGSIGTLELIILILSLTTGSLILMWVGDLVTEYGIGNGISLLIFAGIISRLPTGAAQFISTIESTGFINALVFIAVALLVIFGIVLVNEGTRNITIEYGRRSNRRGGQSTNYLPIKVNQAGVIPIIFAVSVVLVPSFLGPPLASVENELVSSIGVFLSTNFVATSPVYNIFYFLMVFAFTFFYTAFQFDPKKISDDIKKRGGFIPGIRPGLATERYLKQIINKLTLVGATFLGLVAIMPYLVGTVLGLSFGQSVGGTGLLIVVSVVLETIRQLESMMVTRNYDSFL